VRLLSMFTSKNSAFKIRKVNTEDTAELRVVHVVYWRAAYADIVPDNFLANLLPKKGRKD